MSNELAPRPPAEPTIAPERCAYCGAPLAKDFYFCLTCATPWQDVENVLPIVRPATPTDEELVAAKAPNVRPLFWTYFALVAGLGIVFYAIGGALNPPVKLVLGSAAMFATTCVFSAMYWRALAVQFRRLGLTQPAALVALALLVPLLGINFAYSGFIIKGLGAHYKSELVELRAEPGMTEAGLILLFCVFPAIVEETAFRGLVQHWLQVALKPWHAIAFASFLFTVLHFSILSFPYLFLVGMLLGWAKWKTGSLYPSMLIHFLHNLVVIEFFPW